MLLDENQVLFQSTHPVWGATTNCPPHYPLRRFQSTHPVWGATSGITASGWTSPYFNPRTPCGVRPGTPTFFGITNAKFQSTHPVWGATLPRLFSLVSSPNFNPRTPCGVRLCGRSTSWRLRHFNPRTPCGVRRLPLVAVKVGFEFQSTHPVWGATERP